MGQSGADPDPVGALLGHQERHQDDRHAELGLAGATDQQIWTIVAFIKNLPAMSDADYKTWTASP